MSRRRSNPVPVISVFTFAMIYCLIGCNKVRGAEPGQEFLVGQSFVVYKTNVVEQYQPAETSIWITEQNQITPCQTTVVDPAPMTLMEWPYHRYPLPAKKYVTTSVVRLDVLEFLFKGEMKRVLFETVESQQTEECDLKRTEEWVKVKPSS